MSANPALKPVAALACGFLLLAGATLPGWRWQQGLRTEAPELIVCGLLPVLGLLAALWPGDARRVMMRLFGCVLMLPILLLMWGSSLEHGAGAEPPAPRLPEQRLFAGALASQEPPAAALQGSGILLMRSAAFADGSELRLLRFEHAEAASRYREQLAQVLRELPAATLQLVLHGADLLELRAATPALLQARLQALDLPAPPAQTSARGPTPFWPFGLAYTLVHIAFTLGFLLWAGTVTTYMAPAPGAAAVTPALLTQRLRSLAEAGLPVAVSPLGEGGWRIEHQGLAAGRAHAALLMLDSRRRRVQVRELVTADAATPEDEDEACLRGSLADAALDASRPRAGQVWQKVVQTTMIEPTRLGAQRLLLQGERVALAPGARDRFDGEGMVTLLAALVTRSGWAWQPVFWFSRPPRS